MKRGLNFVPRGSEFLPLLEFPERYSINDILHYLGYHPDQTHPFGFGLSKDTVIQLVVFEMFSDNIIFLITKSPQKKISKAQVDDFLHSFSLKKEYNSLTIQDALLEGIKNKSLTKDFLSKVLKFEMEEGKGKVYVEEIEFELYFYDGILRSFKDSNGLSEWTKYFKQIDKELVANYSREAYHFWEGDLEKTIEEVNIQCKAMADLPQGLHNEHIELHRSPFNNVNCYMLLVCYHRKAITLEEFKRVNHRRFKELKNFAPSQGTTFQLGNFVHFFDELNIHVKAERFDEQTHGHLKEVSNSAHELHKPLPKFQPPKELTNYMPKRSLSDIIGREEELLQLRKLLVEDQKIVVINGIGGIGKTTLTEVYLEEYYHNYEHIAWITQENEDLAFDFAGAISLQRNLGVQSDYFEPKELFDEIIRKMKLLERGPCLLVIDNATENLECYSDLFPKTPYWHVLITSREELAKFALFPLDQLSPEKSLLLFNKHCKTITDDQMIDMLLRDVEYHTLTIELLAKTAQRQHLCIDQLAKALEQNATSGVKTRHKRNGGRVNRLMDYLEGIFDFQKLGEGEKWLLKQFACLPPKFESIDTLQSLIKPETSEYGSAFGGLLNGLVEKGWIQFNRNNHSFKVHRIIAEVVWNKQEFVEKDVAPLIRSVIALLSPDPISSNTINKFEKDSYGIVILSRFPDSIDPEVILLQSKLAYVLHSKGDFGAAEKLINHAKASSDKYISVDHPTTADVYNTLAKIYGVKGNYVGAHFFLEKSIAISGKHFGHNHSYTLSVESHRAHVLFRLGDFHGAKILMEKIVNEFEKQLGEDHPTTANHYSSLAFSLRLLGEHQQAKELSQKAILILENHMGKKHPNTIAAYSNLATILRDLGESTEAKVLCERAIHYTELNFGNDHPKTALLYSNLGMILKDLGDYEKAREFTEKARQSDEKNFGPEHPITFTRYSNLAIIYKDLGKLDLAKQLLDKAKKASEKVLGMSHPRTATIYLNLAIVLMELQKFEDALPIAEWALAVYKKLYPEGHSHLKEAKMTVKNLNQLMVQ